jgi:hypothetical protein
MTIFPFPPRPQLSAELIGFPTKFRTGKIRRTAELLAGRRPGAAESYWRQVINGMVGQMKKAGFADAVIDAEIQAFSEAVQLELRRQHHFQPTGDDAA